MKILTYVSLVLLMLSACAEGNNHNVEDPKEHAEKFFELYKDQDPQTALDYIYSDELITVGDQLQENIGQMKNQLGGLEERMGPYKSHDLIESRELGSKLKAYSYLAHYRDQPLHIIFVFHKPADNWRVLYFNYSDNVEGRLIEKLQNLE